MGETIPERHRRAETPFKRRDTDQSVPYKPRVNPSDQQRDWASRGLCVGCGGWHSVFDPSCKARLSKEQAKATLNAIRYGKGGNRTTKANKRLHSRSSPLVPPPPAGPPGAGQKRPREAGSGITPEAKKRSHGGAQGQQDPKLTLCIREKDNAPLTVERNASLQSSVNEKLFTEFYMQNRMPPKINKWERMNLVLRITMRDEAGLRWMRGALEASYQVQTPEEYKRARGRVFIAFLQDRFNPGITSLTRQILAKIVEMEGSAMGIRTLFELKLAAKVPNGLAVHLIMDEEAERIFEEKNYKLDILSAGGVPFQDERVLRARARANRIQRLKPRPATKGLLQGGAQGGEEPVGQNNLMVSEKEGTPSNPVTVGDSPAGSGRAAAVQEGEGRMDWSEEVEKGEKEKEKGATTAAASAPSTPGELSAEMEVDKDELDELNETGQELMDAYLQAQGGKDTSQDE